MGLGWPQAGAHNLSVRKQSALAVFFALAVLASLPAGASARGCKGLLDSPERGANAVRELGDDLDRAADRNNLSEAELVTLLRKDKSMWLNRCASLFVVEPKRSRAQARSAATSEPVQAAAYPLSQTFSLHSRPSASRVIYLDFKGSAAKITDTRWSATAYSIPAFSIDGDLSSFSASEKQAIQRIWVDVSEDFSALDVDVTTEVPASDALVRSSSGDSNYGTRVGFTASQPWGGSCGCGGVAFIGTYDNVGQPATPSAWAFTGGAGTVPSNLGMVASHEAGHNLGLYHWGHNVNGATSTYTSGFNTHWGPIMGAPYGKQLTHWTDGDYGNAWMSSGGTQDDLAVIESNGLARLSDDFPDSRASAQALGSGDFDQAGRITTRADVDWFSFTSAGGAADLVAMPEEYGSNLDLELNLYDSSGNLVESSNPALCSGGTGFACGTWGRITRTLSAGTYYLRVDGVGYGGASDVDRITDYHSLGSYRVVLANLPTITTSSLASGTLTSPYAAQVSLSSDLPVASLAVVSGALPSGLTLSQDNEGAFFISGTPTQAGTFNFTLQATDRLGRVGATQALSLTVADLPAPTVSPASLPKATRLTAYKATITASSPEGKYTFSVTGLPAGLSVAARASVSSPLVIQGTPTTAGTSSVTVIVTTPAGKTTTVSYSLVVDPLPVPQITGTSLPDGVVGQSFNGNIGMVAGAGRTTPRVTGGSLPAGLSLRSNGSISGKPRAPGSFTVTFTATDKFSQTDSQTISFTVTEEKPGLSTSSVLVGRSGIIQPRFTCAKPLGCSPGSGVLTVTQGGQSGDVRVTWKAIAYGGSSAVRVFAPVFLGASQGSTVSLSLSY